MAKSTKVETKKPETIEEARALVVSTTTAFEAAKKDYEAKGKKQRDEEFRTTPEFKLLVATDKAKRAAERALKALEKATARAGETSECQVCERHQKTTRDGNLVHHGYARPGWGCIVGDCYGAGYAPFPAHDRLDAWLEAVEKQVAHLAEVRVALDTAKSVTVEEKDYDKFISRARGYATKAVTYTEPTVRLERPEADFDADRAAWTAYLENSKTWEKWESVLAGKKRAIERQSVESTKEAARVRARIEKAKSLGGK